MKPIELRALVDHPYVAEILRSQIFLPNPEVQTPHIPRKADGSAIQLKQKNPLICIAG